MPTTDSYADVIKKTTEKGGQSGGTCSGNGTLPTPVRVVRRRSPCFKSCSATAGERLRLDGWRRRLRKRKRRARATNHEAA